MGLKISKRWSACWIGTEERLVDRHRLLPRVDGHRRTLRVEGRAPAHVAHAAVVAEHDEPALDAIEGAVLEGAQERLDGGIAEPFEGLEGFALSGRLGEQRRDGLEITRRGRRSRAGRGGLRHPGSQRHDDEQREAAYDFSDSHTRLPPTVS